MIKTMTYAEIEDYCRVLMKLYEKALLEYGEARVLWKAARAKIRIMSSDDRTDFNYKSYRESDLLIFHPWTIQEIIHRAWSARCKALKLKEEIRFFSGQ